MSLPHSRGLFEEAGPMKRALSVVREQSPFATPPRVLVVADEETAGQAVALAEALDEAGAETEVRFGEVANLNSQTDAVIVASVRGYRVTQHHPILERFLPQLRT
jgi:hypothetical protein